MKSDATAPQKNGKPQTSTLQMRMVDLNLFRVFDALMLHRSVRVDIEMVCDPSADRDSGLQWLIGELAASMVDVG